MVKKMVKKRVTNPCGIEERKNENAPGLRNDRSNFNSGRDTNCFSLEI